MGGKSRPAPLAARTLYMRGRLLTTTTTEYGSALRAAARLWPWRSSRLDRKNALCKPHSAYRRPRGHLHW